MNAAISILALLGLISIVIASGLIYGDKPRSKVTISKLVNRKKSREGCCIE